MWFRSSLVGHGSAELVDGSTAITNATGLKVNVVVVLGSERLFSDVSRRFAQAHTSTGEEPIDIIKLSKSGGCVDRDEQYLRSQRYFSIRSYFFGGASFTLSPHTQTVDLASLQLLRMTDRKRFSHMAELCGNCTS